MRTLIVVFGEPDIKIFLQLRDRAVELLAECNAVELIEQRLVEALANAVRLRAPRLSARVIDVLDREVELIFVVLGLAAIFRAPVGKHATDSSGSQQFDEFRLTGLRQGLNESGYVEGRNIANPR